MANWWDDAPLADAAPSGGPAISQQARDLAIRTIYGEAADEPDEGKAAVAAVIRNRVQSGKYGGKDVQGVVMAPNQFEPWSRSDARNRMMSLKPDSPDYQRIGQIVDGVFSGQNPDPTGGATHFFAPEAQAALGRRPPAWAKGDAQAIGRHTFYAPEGRVAMGYAPEEKRPTDVSASKKANWWDDAPLAQDGAAPKPVDTSGLPRVRISKAPDPPDRGALDAGARGVAQGLTANFGDEIRGLVEASGANPDDPASLVKLISGALKYWTGDADAKKRYEETVKREREINKAAEEQHSVASTVGNIAGAVALPIGAAGQAATLPGRMAAGSGVGAALGGAAGVGEGVGVVDSLSRGAVGAAAGGALGGVAPAAIEGVVRGARAAVTPIANAARGVRNVDDEAARRVVTALERDRAIDPQAAQRLTPNEYAASVQSGGPATIMDIGGEQTRALARSAANTSPEGRAVMNRTINDRFEGQSGRVAGWLRNTFHFPDADAQAHAIREVARNVNRPNYARAMREGETGVWDAELQRLAGAPAIQEAARGAIPSLANRGITEGFRAPRTNPLVFDRQTGEVSLRTTPDGVRTIPDLRFWDQIKRNIDAMISKAERYGDTSKVEELTQLNQRLVAHLDTRVESYAAARAGAAHFFGARDALEAGQNFVSKNMSASEARRALTQMTPQERQLFQDGFVSRFVETLSQVGDRRSILNKIAESPAAREKLNIALGRARAEELEAGLRVEGIMDLARNAVQGNSTTARQLAELGLAGGAYGFSGGGINPFTDPGAVVNAALVYGVARGRNVINERLSRRVAEMLVSNDPRIITRGIQTIARNQTLFNSLRSADRGLARVGGEQSGGLPALQAAGVSRAEDQPDVPRPPGQ